MSDSIKAMYLQACGGTHHAGDVVPWMLGPELCPALRQLLLTPGLERAAPSTWWSVIESAHRGILLPDWERVRGVLEDGHAPAKGDIDAETPEGAHWAAWWADAPWTRSALTGYIKACGHECPGRRRLLQVAAEVMQSQLADASDEDAEQSSDAEGLRALAAREAAR